MDETKYLYNELRRNYLFYFSRLLSKAMVEPDMLQIMLTYKCNLKCKICDVWSKNSKVEMTTSQVKSLIDQGLEMGIKTIYFTGGEALLRPDIFDLIDYAARPGIITTVNTNGSFITKEIAKKIVSSKLRNITFSIDSPKAETHNWIRGEKVFERARQAIEYINYYKKQFKREVIYGPEKTLDIAITSVIMKHNIDDLIDLFKLAKRLQCCAISFQPLVYNGNLLETYNTKSEFFLQDEDIIRLEEVFQKLERIKRKLSPTYVDNLMIPKFVIDLMPQKTIQYFKKENRKNTCFAGFNRVFVDPQGKISFVCFENFGSIKDNSLEKVWHSPKAALIRKRIKSCQVNCTQFCSERPESESIYAIQQQFFKGLTDTVGKKFLNKLKRLAKKGEVRLMRWLDIFRLKKKSFQRFYIAITDRCSLKCIMCTTTTHQSKIEDELTVKQWKTIIKNISRHEVESIGFGGGEPLLRKDDLKKLIPGIVKKKIRVDIVTNGTLLDEEFLKYLKKYRKKIFFVVSLDGLEEDNDYIRGKGVFKKVIKALNLLEEYDYTFAVSSVLMPENFLGYVDFLKFLSKSYPNIRLDVQPVIPHNEIYYRRKNFNLDEKQLAALKNILIFLERNQNELDLCRPLEIINKYWDYFTNTLYVENQCKMGIQSFNINSRGNIWICGKEIEYSLEKYKIEEVMETAEYKKEMTRVEKCRVPCLQGLVI